MSKSRFSPQSSMQPSKPGELAAALGLCARCGRQPPSWPGQLCGRCNSLAQRQVVLLRRWSVAGRWMCASMIEVVGGLGAGAAALVPLASAATGRPLGVGLAVALLLVVSVATTVAVAHAAIMLPVIRRWKLWGLTDGVELILSWAAALALVGVTGWFPGAVALASAASGVLAAAVQSRLLAPQSRRAPTWLPGAVLAWALAGAVATLIEHNMANWQLGVICGVAASRLVFGALSSPLLGWVLAGIAPTIPEQQVYLHDVR